MTKDHLFILHQNLTRVALDLMKRKNADYTSIDPLQNFRLTSAITGGDVSISTGILVRMGDKLSRLHTVTKNGQAQVKSESLKDTVLDLINYAVLFYAAAHEEIPADNGGGESTPSAIQE